MDAGNGASMTIRHKHLSVKGCCLIRILGPGNVPDLEEVTNTFRLKGAV